MIHSMTNDSKRLGRENPRVSVGLMVYNEESHLVDTLDSILKQDFQDYEILIADNASEDGTGEIAREYAKHDQRIRYIRRQRNIGALQNYNRLVEEASGEYFVLAGAHDLWSDNYLSCLEKALNRYPEAVIAYAPTVWIDKNGQDLKKRTGFVDTSGWSPTARFNLSIWSDQNALYGMFRLNVLRKTRLQLEILGSGAVLQSELAILGSFVVVPEAKWFRRVIREDESRNQRLSRYSRVLFPEPRRLILPHWRIPPAFISAAIRAKVSPMVKFLLICSSTTSFLRYGLGMLMDVNDLFLRLLSGKKHYLC